MAKKDSFFVNRIKSVGYALKGAILLLKTESSIKIQFFIGLLTVAAGFYYHISSTEWMIQILAIGIVMGTEGLNTAIEAMADFIHPDFNSKIGFIKDISAGAVFIAATAAVLVGLIIYMPKVF